MNQHIPKSRRLAFRPMSLAIHSLSLATASSVFLWTMGGGFDTPLPPLASAATKSAKSDKETTSRAETKVEEPLAAGPSAVGTSPEAEIPAVKLNHISATWEKVIKDLAKQSQSQLVMDRVPKGRYTRRDSNKYNRHDAVRILNKDIEPLGFRLIEKGDFLILLDLPSQRPRYQAAVLPAKHEQPDAAEPDTSSPFVQRVDSITRRPDEKSSGSKQQAATKTAGTSTEPARPESRPVRPIAHEDAPEFSPPEPLGDDIAQDASKVVFRPRHRKVVELSKQVHKTMKSRSQLISAGRNQLPAFKITTALPGDESVETATGTKQVVSTITIAIDEANEELLIDGAPRDTQAALKLLRVLDRPFDDETPVQLTSSSKYVCQIAHQLPEEIEKLRAARGTEVSAKAPKWNVDGDQIAQLDERGAPRAGLPNVPPALGDVLGSLKGEVNIEAVDDLGVLILRGNEKDVEQVMKVIRELEKLSEATAPKVHLLYLKNVDSESLSDLLTTVYERLTKFPGKATQPRQSAAILPINKPNSLLIIAPEADLKAILELAEELDSPVDPQTEFQVYRLKNAVAQEVSDMITQFYLERVNLGAKVLVTPDARTNSVIVRAQPRDLDEVTALIRKIDRDETGTVNQLRIFPLKNALAAELAAVMNAAIQSVIAPPTSGTGGGGGQQGGLQGLNTAQIDEKFKNVRSAVLQIFSTGGNGDKIRSGILADIRITPDSRVNSLVVSASEKSMSLIEELIKQLDRPTTTVSEIKVFTLANADAELMVQQLNALFNNQQQGGQGQGGNQRQNLGIALEGAADSSSSLVPLKFSVDKRTNSVIAVGAREALGVVEAILLRLDESDLRARQNVVIRLQNSQATLIAQSIAQFYQSQRDIAQADPNLMSSVEQMEKEVVVVPDTTNNSLLLSATPRYFKNIESMILKLDAAPRQVIIQALLVEVELQNTDEFGIELGFQDPTLFKRSPVSNLQQFSTTTSQTQTSTVSTNKLLSLDGTPGFNFNNPAIPLGNNVSSDASNPATVAAQSLTNFSLGRVNSDLGFGGLVLSAGSDAVNVLIRALSAHRKITVLSRPQIRALDNQMAEIFSGQNIPIITGFTANGTTGVNTPTVTQKDAGVQLQVMPRITADGNVVMMLYAQRSQYRQQGVPLSTDATGKTVSSPILDISRLQTTISVPTGNTVVIGGLINTRDESFTNKAPFLSEIPLLGHLFRFDSRSTRRVELLVFLTPRIISGPIDEETIKDVELGRMHIIESEAEDLHGPLRALPCPDDIFTDPNNAPQSVPPAPMLDPDTKLNPPPAPTPDPSTSVIRDPSFSPVSARIKYTEEDPRTSSKVEQAKGETKQKPGLFGKKAKKTEEK